MKPRVSIVILNWNGVRDTLECLESVYNQDYPNYDVIVVDNGSTDQSIELIKQEYPNIAIIENETNLGYAEGNNIGLKFASSKGCDYLFILNNDTVLNSNCLSTMIKDIEKHPDTAAISPISFYYDQPKKCHYAGGEISGIGLTLHHKKPIDEIEQLINPYTTEWLTGCAILLRTAVYYEIGGFDNKFYLLFEDADLSLRMRHAGYTLMISPEAHIFHKVSASFGVTWSPSYFYYYTRNGFLFIEKNFKSSIRFSYYYQHFRQLRRRIRKVSSIHIIQYKRAFISGIKHYFFRNFGKSNDYTID